MKGMGSDHLSGSIAKTEARTLAITEISEEDKNATSELYLVDCRMQSIETIGDTTPPAASRRIGTRVVTLIYLSFTNGDISIAVPGGGVTLEGGYKWNCEVGVGDAALVSALARENRTN
jgi:hypothetical protein